MAPPSHARRSSLSLSLALSLSLSLACLACDKPAPSAEPDAATAMATPSASASSAAPDASMADADASAPAKPTGKSVDTPAGTVSEVGAEIQLSGKPLYPPPDCPAGGKDGCAKVKALKATMESVKILRHFDGPGGPKSIVLVQTSPAGNACNGGPLFFVRLAKDVPPQYSDVFDYCGGPDPMVGAMPDKILINVPAHPGKAGAPVAAKTMEYDIAAGTLQAAAPAAPKKKR